MAGIFLVSLICVVVAAPAVVVLLLVLGRRTEDALERRAARAAGPSPRHPAIAQRVVHLDDRRG